MYAFLMIKKEKNHVPCYFCSINWHIFAKIFINLIQFFVMKKEIWKDIEGYEGLYEVSNFGNVRSVDRIVTCSNGKKRLRKGRILKPAKQKNGYLFCILYKNSKPKLCKVHRLVAAAFIPNPDKLPEVNHKDENKANNFVFVNKDDSVDLNKSNLEWCTRLYNMRYGTRLKHVVEKRSKPVLQIDKETNEVIAEYPSAREAARKLNIDQGSISACCRGKQKTAYGFKWQYK